MLTPEILVMVIAFFLIGGLVKGVIGMGLPMVVVPGLALMMPLHDAMAIFLVPGVVANIWQALSGPWLGVLLKRMWSYLAASFLAIWVGVSIVAATRSDAMVLVLACLLCSYSAWSLVAPRLPPPGRHEVWMAPLAGGLGGVMMGLTGTYIVPGLLYLETLRLERDMFVQALGLILVTITATLALSKTTVGLVSWDHATLSAIGLVPAGLGIWSGRRIRRRVSETLYRKGFFVVLFMIGVYMGVRTLNRLGMI